MAKLFVLVFLLFGALNLASCAKKSSEQDAQASAQNKVERHNNLKDTINAQGTPRATWSDEQLNSYESELNQLESLENELNAVNGTNGITIYGANNGQVISAARGAVAKARAAKVKLSATHTNAESVADLVSKVQSLAADEQQIGKLLMDLSNNPSREDLVEALKLENRGLADFDEQIKILSRPEFDDNVEAQNMRQLAIDGRAKLVPGIEKLQRRLDKKPESESNSTTAAVESSVSS